MTKNEIRVINCARCGKDHVVKLHKFKENSIDNYKYWTMCPDLNEPILIKFK